MLVPRVYGTIAVLLLGRAVFLLWRKEHRRLELERQSQLGQRGTRRDDRPNLKLHGEIDWVHLAREPAKPQDLQVLVIASIVNRGAPSSADRWALSVQLPGGEIYEGVLRKIPANFVFRFTGEAREIRGSDALYEKTLTTPIPSGGKVRGILWLQLEGVDGDLINSQGTLFTLWFQDSFGNVQPASCQIAESGKPLPAFFPGLHS